MVFLLKNYLKTDCKSFSEVFYIAERRMGEVWSVAGKWCAQGVGVLNSVFFWGVMLLGKPASPSDEGSVSYLVGFLRSILHQSGGGSEQIPGHQPFS